MAPNDQPLALSGFTLLSLPYMYRDFDGAVSDLEPDRWTELTYEQLVADPEAALVKIAADLALGEVDRTALGAHLAGVRSHRRNRHKSDPALARDIADAWQWYFQRFGYAP